MIFQLDEENEAWKAHGNIDWLFERIWVPVPLQLLNMATFSGPVQQLHGDTMCDWPG